MASVGELLPWDTETPGERLFLVLYDFVKARVPRYKDEHTWVFSNDGMREFFRLVMTLELTHRCMNLAVDAVESLGDVASSEKVFIRLYMELSIYDSEPALRRISELAHRAAEAYVGRKLSDGRRNEAHRDSTGWCCWCARPTSNRKSTPDKDRATVEHIWPEFLGGTSDSTNLTIACKPCNSERQHAFSWAWFGLQSCNEKLDANSSLPRSVTLALGLYRLMRVASGQTRLASHATTLKDALLLLKGASPSVQSLGLTQDRRYTFFELLTLTSD